MIDKSSLLYWWPKIKDLDIPMPKTEILEVPRQLFLEALEGFNIATCPSYELVEKEYSEPIKKAAQKIGYPLFLRTDQASGKHEWKDTCYVEREADLITHVFRVIEANEMADIMGLDYKALVFREFIPLDWKFKAFWGEMPVARERRYFIKDGRILCHHPYWIEDAIAESRQPQEPNWRELLKDLNTETKEEVKLLTEYSTKVASVLEGYWSVDFAHANYGRWILIDMALGGESWHPKCAKDRKKGSA